MCDLVLQHRHGKLHWLVDTLKIHVASHTVCLVVCNNIGIPTSLVGFRYIQITVSHVVRQCNTGIRT